MLILTRYINQSFCIGVNGEIKITLLDVRGKAAKIGIAAPKDVPVHREEVLDRIRKEIAKEKTEDLGETEEGNYSPLALNILSSQEEGNK